MSDTEPGGPFEVDPAIDETDTERGVYRTYHDMSTDGLTLTISEALATVSGRDVTQLVSDFSRYADPDAVNRLFRARADGEPREAGRMTLVVEGYTVTVHSDGEILVESDALATD